MKKLVFISFAFFAILSLANAQSKQTNALRFEAESVEINCKANKITYAGNASCIADELTIKNADKIEFVNKTKKLTANNVREFSFGGNLNVASELQFPNRIEYTVGRTVAFLK